METKNWKWFKIGDLFSSVYKGVAYNAIELTECPSNYPNAIRYVTRTDVTNGCKCYVINENFSCVESGNAITIGDTTSTVYYQGMPFICGDHMVVLRSPILNELRGIFIVSLLNKERFRYCYGRAFRKDIIKETEIKLPSIKNENNEFVPDWQWIENYVKETIIPQLPPKTKSVWQQQFNSKPLLSKKLELKVAEWKWFRYDEVFEICKGFYNKKPKENPQGKIPFIGATDSNNGVTSMHDMETIELASKTGEAPNAALEDKIFGANCITVSNNGSVGYAFYQPKDFTCSHDVNPLYLNKKWRKKLNVYISMFLCSLIEKERFRWAYGRKWRPVRMPDSLIKLPAIKTAAGEYDPDWQWMEDYIKGLPYSGCLE